ncbi:MAG: hypothetical protein J6S82_08360, partial [Bacteroidales bacterium]|nr:hypothetical protein [Bacteroidales bacterium]
MLCLCTLPLLHAQCPNPNLDFSYGNFTGWQCYISNSGYSNGNTCYDSLTWTLCPQAVNGRHTIMSDIYDVDPHTCNGDTAGNELLPLVPNGFRYSARIGNSNTGAEAESIRYRLAVDSSNYWVTVHYAAVLEFSNHVDDREARFGVRFQDTAGNLLPVGNVDLSIKDTASMIHCYKVYWKDWDMLGVNLSPWVGQTVEIVIYAADCGLYGHFGYGYAVCECGILKSDVRYCQNDSIAVLSVPEGCRSYRWTDSAGRVLDTVPKIKISIPKTGAVYYCQVGDGQGWRDTLSLQIRKTLITPSILSQRDSLTPFIHLSNGSVVTNGELLNQTWRISRRGAGTEYVCNDSAFDYCFKDTGWYEVQLTVDALNRCSDTCSRWFRVEPSPTDVQLLAILNPDADTLWEVRSILPEVRIVNHGNYRVCGGNLVIELCDSTMSVIRSIREEIGIIGAVKSLDVLFSDFLSTRVSGYTTVFSGRYYLKAYMDSFPHDTIHGNDTLLKPLFLNYQKYVNLSVLDCDGFFRPDYDWIPLRELPIKLTRENLFTIRAIIKKYSNYMLDSVHLTAQILDSSFKVVDSQDVWIPAAKQYNCSYSEFYELCWAYDEIGNFVFPDKSVRAPGYTGHFYVKVFFDANPYDTDHANDTIMVRRNCYYKAIMDLEMLSVCPGADSLKGGEKSCPKVMVGNVGDFDAKNVIVEVYVSDSNHVLLSHSTDTFSRLSDTLSWIPVGDTVCRYLSSPYKAPNYTGVYYLKTIVWSMNENGVYADKFRKNDTAECVGHCFYNPAGNVTLLSVRPDEDSLEGGNLTFPRVVLCNTGRDGMKNIGLEVLVVDKYDTVVAHLRDTIAAIPGGDTAELAFRSRYTVPDYTGSY